MTVPYQIVDGTAIIVIRTATGIQPVTVSSDHPFHKDILAALVSGEHDQALELLDAQKRAVETVRKALTFTVDNDIISCDIDGNITLNGLPMEPFITKCIEDRVKAGAGLEDLVRFQRRLNRNSVPKIKEQLFKFLNRGGFQLLPDGRFVAYKGVYKTDDPNIFASAHERDFYYELGVKTYENVKECDYDVDVSCGRGLHVGTKSYASDYGDTMVEVFVDPAEVICVPKDSGGQKLRGKALFCNAVVEGHTEAPTSTLRRPADQDPAGGEPDDFDDFDDDDDDEEPSEVGAGDEQESAEPAPPVASKRTYYNTHTGASIRAEKSPGSGWSSTKPKPAGLKKKVDETRAPGARTYYNKETGESSRFITHPGPGWSSHKPKG